MSDARFDAVVLGGGHHGTIIAPYLARAGLSVLVLERSAHLGGGACTSEGPAPGFLMNHCSHWTRFYGHPAYRDFALYDEGLRYVFPEQNEGMIFDDGSSLIGHSAYRVVDPDAGRQERSEENIRATREQIAPLFGSGRRDVPATARRSRTALETGLPPAPFQLAAAVGYTRSARAAARRSGHAPISPSTSS